MLMPWLHRSTVGFAIVLAIGCNSTDPVHARRGVTTADTPPVSAQPPLAKPVVAKISAVDLCKQYMADEGAADENFKGKFIELTGVVATPLSNGAGEAGFFMISGGGQDASNPEPLVRCYIAPDDEKQSGELAAGAAVTLRGFCEGRSAATQQSLLDLKRCVITKAP